MRMVMVMAGGGGLLLLLLGFLLLLRGIAGDSLNVRRVGAWPYGPAYAVAVDSARNLVFLGSGGVVLILDGNNPASPTKVGEIRTGRGLVRGFVYDAATRRLYVVAGGDLRIVDVRDPANPTEVGFYDTPGEAWGVVVSGSYAYVADGEEGLRVVDVSNPANPIEVGFYDTPGWALDVAVSGGYVYVADGEMGLQILEFLGTKVVGGPSPLSRSPLRVTPDASR